MLLTSKGEEILESMKAEYGEEKGKEVFYASVNVGKISGVDSMNQCDDPKALKAATQSKDEAHEMIPPSITLAEMQKKNEEYWKQSYDFMNKDKDKAE